MRVKGCVLAAMAATAMLAAPGCLVGADLLNPDFVSSLGLDLGPFSSRGTLILLFTNNTGLPATFAAFSALDAEDLSRDTRNTVVTVPAGEQRNEVLECPLEVISPGSVNPDFSLDFANAVTVIGATAQTAVPYAGTPLFEGMEYTCGDVIEITLDPAGTAYVLSVRILPGR